MTNLSTLFPARVDSTKINGLDKAEQLTWGETGDATWFYKLTESPYFTANNDALDNIGEHIAMDYRFADATDEKGLLNLTNTGVTFQTTGGPRDNYGIFDGSSYMKIRPITVPQPWNNFLVCFWFRRKSDTPGGWLFMCMPVSDAYLWEVGINSDWKLGCGNGYLSDIGNVDIATPVDTWSQCIYGFTNGGKGFIAQDGVVVNESAVKTPGAMTLMGQFAWGASPAAALKAKADIAEGFVAVDSLFPLWEDNTERASIVSALWNDGNGAFLN